MIYHETEHGILHCGDCLDILPTLADKSVDLVLTDPPYGIGAYANGTMGGGVLAKQSTFAKTNWDNEIPSAQIFEQMTRASKEQIIWGGNYFVDRLWNSSCWLVWDKVNGKNNFADCELAWTSYKTAVRIFRHKWQGMLQENMKEKDKRYHPTQKPISLFEWCLSNYSEPGNLILDPFAGSGTTAIACVRLNRKYILIEKEEKYCEIAARRIETELDQTVIDFS